MNGLSPKDVKKQGLEPITSPVTNEEISQQFGITAGGSLHLRVDLEVSSVTVSTGITAKLQHRSAGGALEDLVGANASVSITGNGTFSITQCVERTADQPNMPLRKVVAVALTTGAGDSITIDKVWVSQAL